VDVDEPRERVAPRLRLGVHLVHRAAAVVVEHERGVAVGCDLWIERVAVLPLLEEEACADLARDAGAADLGRRIHAARLDRRVRVACDGPHAAQHRENAHDVGERAVEPERASPQSAATSSASTTSEAVGRRRERDERIGVAKLAPARGQSVPRDEREEPFHRDGS
jgi:hypothetical protein